MLPHPKVPIIKANNNNNYVISKIFNYTDYPN